MQFSPYRCAVCLMNYHYHTYYHAVVDDALVWAICEIPCMFDMVFVQLLHENMVISEIIYINEFRWVSSWAHVCCCWDGQQQNLPFNGRKVPWSWFITLIRSPSLQVVVRTAMTKQADDSWYKQVFFDVGLFVKSAHPSKVSHAHDSTKSAQQLWTMTGNHNYAMHL